MRPFPVGNDKNYYDHKLTEFEALPDSRLLPESSGRRSNASDDTVPQTDEISRADGKNYSQKDRNADGTTIYLEEVRTGRQELAMQTMYNNERRHPERSCVCLKRPPKNLTSKTIQAHRLLLIM